MVVHYSANDKQAGVPGGLVGGPRAYYQHLFRGFKSHRVHARDFFLQQIYQEVLISGKRESVRSLHSMKIDEKWEC